MKYGLLIAALLLATPAAAKDEVDCRVALVKLPTDLAGWASSAKAEASASAAQAQVVGTTQTRIALHPSAHVTFAAAPGKAPVTGLYAGFATFDVAKAGRVKVALDKGAWVDVVKDGVALKSVAHGHGPACSGIRKIVQFDLTPGRYLIQIANAPQVEIGAMVVAPR